MKFSLRFSALYLALSVVLALQYSKTGQGSVVHLFFLIGAVGCAFVSVLSVILPVVYICNNKLFFRTGLALVRHIDIGVGVELNEVNGKVFVKNGSGKIVWKLSSWMVNGNSIARTRAEIEKITHGYSV